MLHILYASLEALEELVLFKINILWPAFSGITSIFAFLGHS